MAESEQIEEKHIKPSIPSQSNEALSKVNNSQAIISHHSRNKSVQWADWEMKNVVEFTGDKDTDLLIDEYSQTEIEPFSNDQVFPLIDSLVQTSMEISSIASRSPSASLTTCTTMEEYGDKQTALADLITHLEDTAALLRDYLAPPEVNAGNDDYTKNEQTFFLLKYQIVIVLFTQLVSILILTLFDHLTKNVRDTGYHVLTISCGSILQLLNMVLVSFATAVLSRQMLKYKVEGQLMAQTYLATVITFAGLYFIIYRIDPNSWEIGGTGKTEDSIAIVQFIKMFYLSVSAATLCGAANIQPNYWHVTLILCFQSTINFVYFASILAQTIGNYNSYTVEVRRSSSMSRARAR